jgi:hypothetical protein
MSTRATLIFEDRRDKYYVYRHSDGFPEDIKPDIEKAIKHFNDRCDEVGQLVSTFLGIVFDPEKRLQPYEMTTSIHGDESYLYYIRLEDGKFKLHYDR